MPRIRRIESLLPDPSVLMGWSNEYFGGDAGLHSNIVALPRDGSEQNLHSGISAIHEAARSDCTYVYGSLPLHCRIVRASNTREDIGESTASVTYGLERFLPGVRADMVSRRSQEPARVLWQEPGCFRNDPNVLQEFNAEALLSQDWRTVAALAPVPAEPPTRTHDIPAMIQAELDAFAAGIGAIHPSDEVVMMAIRIARVVVANVEHPDITMDIDGELSFDLRRRDGRLVLAEMEVDGTIHASLYDRQNMLLEHMPSATEAEFSSLFQS